MCGTNSGREASGEENGAMHLRIAGQSPRRMATGAGKFRTGRPRRSETAAGTRAPWGDSKAHARRGEGTRGPRRGRGGRGGANRNCTKFACASVGVSLNELGTALAHGALNHINMHVRIHLHRLGRARPCGRVALGHHSERSRQAVDRKGPGCHAKMATVVRCSTSRERCRARWA